MNISWYLWNFKWYCCKIAINIKRQFSADDNYVNIDVISLRYIIHMLQRWIDGDITIPLVIHK